MIILEIAEYLHNQGIGTYNPDGDPDIAHNIFIEQMPDEPDLAIGLYTSSGFSPDTKTYVGRPGFQVIVRGDRNPLTAAELAQEIFTALHSPSVTQFTTNGVFILQCASRQSEPISLGPDANGRFEYSLNFQVITGGS